MRVVSVRANSRPLAARVRFAAQDTRAARAAHEWHCRRVVQIEESAGVLAGHLSQGLYSAEPFQTDDVLSKTGDA